MRKTKPSLVLNDQPVINPTGCSMRYRGKLWLRYNRVPGLWFVGKFNAFCPGTNVVFRTEDGRQWRFTKGDTHPSECTVEHNDA